MQQLSAYRFYELGTKLRALFTNDAPGRGVFTALTEAQMLLDALIKGDLAALDAAQNEAARLLDRISDIFKRHFIDPNTRQLRPPAGEELLDQHEITTLRGLVEKFDHALAADLNRTPVYLAEPTGIYSTPDLAQNAEKVFSPRQRAHIAVAAQTEFRAAGRALAFGFGTAAGLHIMRAIEIAVRDYYEGFVGASTAESGRNFNTILKKLSALAEEEPNSAPTDDARPDRRVVEILNQVRHYYRNPLQSPTFTLSAEDATAFFAMATALIGLMAKPEKQNEPDQAEK